MRLLYIDANDQTGVSYLTSESQAQDPEETGTRLLKGDDVSITEKLFDLWYEFKKEGLEINSSEIIAFSWIGGVSLVVIGLMGYMFPVAWWFLELLLFIVLMTCMLLVTFWALLSAWYITVESVEKIRCMFDHKYKRKVEAETEAMVQRIMNVK